MAGLDTLLSLAGGSGGQQSNKYVTPSVPVSVNPIGINLGQIYQPSNLGTTGTVPLLGNRAPTLAAAEQSSFVTGSNINLPLILGAVALLLIAKRR